MNALLGAALATLLLAAVAWWLAGLTPGWYQPLDPNDKAALQLGETAEYRLAEELQKIRPPQEPWRLRIPEDAVNAWLASRLPQWLSGQGVEWPAELSPPQIRMTPSGIEVAIASADLGDRIGRLRVLPNIVGNQLALSSPTLRVGRLPLPLPMDWIRSSLEEAINQAEDLSFLAELLRGERIDAVLPLVDKRQVRVRRITFEPGACVIEASTQRPRPDG